MFTAKIAELPTLSAVNAEDVVLKFPNYEVTLRELKTLDTNLKRGEEAVIKKSCKNFLKGCLSHIVMDAFMTRLETKHITAVPSSFLSQTDVTSSRKKYEARLQCLRKRSWEEFKLILLPFMNSPSQWILGAVRSVADAYDIYGNN